MSIPLKKGKKKGAIAGVSGNVEGLYQGKEGTTYQENLYSEGIPQKKEFM